MCIGAVQKLQSKTIGGRLLGAAGLPTPAEALSGGQSSTRDTARAAIKKKPKPILGDGSDTILGA